MDVDGPEVPFQWVDPPTSNASIYTAWISTSWNDSNTTPERLNQYLSRWPPSRTPESYGAWISVVFNNQVPSRAPVIEDVAGLQLAFRVLDETGNVSTASIDTIAAEHGVLSGKWLIFADPHSIDARWAQIVNLVCVHRRKGQAKVSTRKQSFNGSPTNEGHVICVYVDDYTDDEDVLALREELREKAGIHSKISFKPDAYTHLGIYAKNKWKIPPTRAHA